MEKIEDVVLRYSGRGMQKLRNYIPDDFCHQAAREILSWERGTVLLATGFYVAGFAETDGPAGTIAVAKALRKLGYTPVILTDGFCEGFFEKEGIEVIYLDINATREDCENVLQKYDPVGLISIERCGKNVEDKYANMRGLDIGEFTAPVDTVFRLAYGRYPTIGVGDGGNEIGMGNLVGIISRKLNLVPCKIQTDVLVIASVSNWGAYGIVAALEKMTSEKLLVRIDWLENYIKETVDMGSVDGVTHEHVVSVDGYDIAVEKEILGELGRSI